MIYMFFMMMWGHVLADYPLQGHLSAMKRGSDPGVPWWMGMAGHSMIHGGFVCWITGSWVLGAAEVMAHFIIDTLKCRGFYGTKTDQILHVLCKVVWTCLAAWNLSTP